jgi:peptide/nickel transport system substrate-binding protein
MAGRDDDLLRLAWERRVTRSRFLRTAAGAAVGASVLGAAACGSDEQTSTGGGGGSDTGSVRRGGTLQVSFSDADTKENLDPSQTELNNDSFYCGQIYESLTDYDENWNVTPTLATEWSANSDATEWTFKLRPNVTFHDGSPFTSKDVAFSIGRLLDESLGSGIYSRLQPSLAKSGIQTPDDLTVVFKLKKSDSLLPLALGARHAHIVKDGTTEFTERTAIGTGPFQIQSFSPAQSWSATKYANYWDKGKPYLDGVRGVVIGEQSTKVQSVTSGQSHIADPINYSAASTVNSSGAAEILEFKASTYILIAMDQRKPPFDNNDVVMAIKLAVDRERLMNAVYQGYGTLTGDVPAPIDDPYYPPSVGERPQDIEQAKQLLAGAGHPDGIDLELITSDSYGGMVDLAVTFAQVVEPAGIRVKINQWSPDTYWDQVWLVKPMYVSYYTRRHPNDILAVTYASNAPWNECKKKNPALDDLLSQGLATADEQEQIGIYQQALEIVANEHGTSIPAFASKLWVKKKNVRGEVLNLSNGMFLKDAYLA